MAGMLCTIAVDLVGKGQTTTETHANAMLVFAAMMLRQKLRHVFATEAELWPFNRTPMYVHANTHRLVSDDHLLHLLSGHARQALPHLHGTDLTRQTRGNRKQEISRDKETFSRRGRHRSTSRRTPSARRVVAKIVKPQVMKKGRVKEQMGLLQ